MRKVIKLVYTVKRTRESNEILERFTVEFAIDMPADFAHMVERMRVFFFAQYPDALALQTEDGMLILTEE